jgi:predicted dehydrogenase
VAVGAVGLDLPRKVYYEKELAFINSRSYGPGRYDPAYEEGGQDYPIGFVRWTEGRNLQAVVDLMGDGRIDVRPLISHRFPIMQAPEAYTLITGKKGEPFLGVLLTYSQDDAGEPQAVQSHPIAPAEPQAGMAVPVAPARREAGPVRLGVLGAGNFATAVMLPAFQAAGHIQLVGIASASGMSARHAADRFKFIYAASQADKIIQDPAVEAVAILTRHNLHAVQSLAALQAGKHVFCEKPLAIRLEDLDALQAALVQSPGRILTCGFNRRFAPLAVQLKAFLQNRREPLAAHYRVNAGYIPLNHWTHDLAQGGGRILGEACHFIDFLVFLVGAAPLEVQARGLPDGGRYREDNVIIEMAFPDGSLGTVAYLANGDKAFPKERVEVLCGGAAAALDDYRMLELVKDGRRRSQASRLRQDKGHKAEAQAFARAVQTVLPPIPYTELFGGMRAAFAALESLRTGKPVRL